MTMSLSVRHYGTNMLASMLSNSAFGNLASFLVKVGGGREVQVRQCARRIYTPINRYVEIHGEDE